MISSLLHDPRSRPTWRALLVVLLAIIGWLAFGPAPPMPDVQGWAKINHLLAFLALGTVASLSQASGWRHAAVTASGLLLYGAFIEAVQAQLPHRHGDWHDLAADAVGLLCGLLLAAALRRATAAAHLAAIAKQGPD
ncbi:MAG TPA: VanZ family protein [Rubrivivax sp.]|nr:VanZ family protein [Rubrivivax sp.]